jgi:MOSC domain-containing protein YiiM
VKSAGLPDSTESSSGEVRHLSFEELEAGLDWVRQSPPDQGRVELIVRRLGEGEREVLGEAQLSTTDGLVGDAWASRKTTSTATGSPNPDRQVTLINARLALLVAERPDRRPLAGDQLYLDLDLGVDNLPPGTRLKIGGALIELTEEPHLGCAKFVRRFGPDAMRFVNSAVGRRHRLRGANTMVIQGGTVHTGDLVTRDPSER